MKFYALVVVAGLIASLGAAPIRKSSDLSVDELFQTAWEFQNKLNPRQEDIDNDVTEFRTSVSNVLKTTSKSALSEVEENAKTILELESPVRMAVSALPVGDCSNNLNDLLSSITTFTGFQSSNCVALYDAAVDDEIQQAQDLISVYDGIFTELQQLVIKAFVGKNQFNEQAEIVSRFELEYERRVAAWEKIKPDVEHFIDTLSDKIDDFNGGMNGCMHNIQESVVGAYSMISTRVQTCIDFDNTPNPFRAAISPLKLEEVLPNQDLSFL